MACSTTALAKPRADRPTATPARMTASRLGVRRVLMIGRRETAARRGSGRETGAGTASAAGAETGAETGGEIRGEAGGETGAATNVRVVRAGFGGSASGTTGTVVRYSGQATHVGLGTRLPIFASVTS